MVVAIVLILAGGAYYAWQKVKPAGLPDGIARSNDRIEAVEIDVSTKIAGRIKEIQADEGDFVTRGTGLAQMDTEQLDAQRREAEAQLQRSIIGVETAQNLVALREAERTAPVAVIAQRAAELDAAGRRLARTEQLVSQNVLSLQVRDDDRAAAEGAKAAVSAAQAQVAATEAANGAQPGERRQSRSV